MTQPQVHQVIYDETLTERLKPARDAVARCAKDLLAVAGSGHHRAEITRLLAAVKEEAEQDVFDQLRGKVTQ
jgi:hypothetical protein